MWSFRMNPLNHYQRSKRKEQFMAEEIKIFRSWSWRMAKRERRKTLKDDECKSERHGVLSRAEKPIVLPLHFVILSKIRFFIFKGWTHYVRSSLEQQQSVDDTNYITQ
jgi:hypothetical protein